MTKPKRIFLSPPYLSGHEERYLAEALASNWIAPLGPHVDAFERELAARVGTTAAVALSSGTAAIHLALRYLRVGPSDTVFCSSLTFIASANPILYLGAQPVFIDSEHSSWNMAPQALLAAFEWAEAEGRLPKAVVVAHLYGQSADLDPIMALCDRYGATVVEDAAESLGAEYKGRPSGSMGPFGIYSFNGNKIITTSGGGMLIAKDPAAIDKARFWATQARDPAPHYQHSEMGYNYRMSNLLAALGSGQLETLDERVAARRAIFERYATALADLEGIAFMPEAPYGRSNRWLTTLLVEPERYAVSPYELIREFEAENIEMRPLWKPLHAQPLFASAPYFVAPGAEGSISDELFAKGLCLPSGSNLTQAEQERVIELLRGMLVRARR